MLIYIEGVSSVDWKRIQAWNLRCDEREVTFFHLAIKIFLHSHKNQDSNDFFLPENFSIYIS